MHQALNKSPHIPFTLSLLPAFLPCSAFCSCSLSCYVPVIFDSSFFLSLLGGKVEDKGGETGTAEVVDGWKRCCINSGLLSGAVHDYHYTEGKILYSPHPYHFSPFFFFQH